MKKTTTTRSARDADIAARDVLSYDAVRAADIAVRAADTAARAAGDTVRAAHNAVRADPVTAKAARAAARAVHAASRGDGWYGVRADPGYFRGDGYDGVRAAHTAAHAANVAVRAAHTAAHAAHAAARVIALVAGLDAQPFSFLPPRTGSGRAGWCQGTLAWSGENVPERRKKYHEYHQVQHHCPMSKTLAATAALYDDGGRS